LNSLDLLATSGGILLLFEVFLFVYGIEERRRRRRAEKERNKERTCACRRRSDLCTPRE